MSDPAFLFANFLHLCRATTYDGEIKVYIFSGPAFSALPFPGLRGGGNCDIPSGGGGVWSPARRRRRRGL